MRDFDERSLTEAVVSRFEGCGDPRLRAVMTSLVRHLHGFIRDVEPTESEWFEAIRFLTRTGQICDERRQEYILLSDVLGASMLVDAINHSRGGAGTESTVLGPFYVENPPEVPFGGDITGGVPGDPLMVEGTVRSVDGGPIAGATVDVWQSDDEGHYDVQVAEVGSSHLRARLRTDGNGRFAFRSIMPSSYPIPTDGPVGQMLEATGRHPFRPAHVHFMIAAPGHERLVTHIFVEGDPYLDSDVVFGVKGSLVRRFEEHATEGQRFSMRYDFVLKPAPAEAERPRCAAEAAVI